MYAGVCGGKVKSVHFFFFSFTTPTQAGLGSLQRFLYLMTSQFKNTVVLEVKSWNYLSAGLIFKHKIGRERRKKHRRVDIYEGVCTGLRYRSCVLVTRVYDTFGC